MTEETCKRLIAHYTEIGRQDLVDDILKNRPNLKVEVPKKETNKKSK